MTDANEGFEPPVGTADEGYRPEIGIESSAEDPWDIPEKPRKRSPTIRDWLDKIKEEGYPDRADFEDPGFPGGRGEIWGGKIPYKPSELQAYDQGGRIGARLGGDMEELSMRETIDTPEGIETLKETDTMQMAGGGARGWKAQMLAEQLAEEQYGKEFYDLPQRTQMEIYQIALDMIDSGGQ
jgi:hypothetical protein